MAPIQGRSQPSQLNTNQRSCLALQNYCIWKILCRSPGQIPHQIPSILFWNYRGYTSLNTPSIMTEYFLCLDLFICGLIANIIVSTSDRIGVRKMMDIFVHLDGCEMPINEDLMILGEEFLFVVMNVILSIPKNLNG